MIAVADRTATVSVEEASTLVLATGARTLPVERDLAPGRWLLEACVSDRPHPPFDRVAMDGIAVRSWECGDGSLFREAAFAPAGAPVETLPSDPGACVRVATGAMLPRGADAVVPVERVDDLGGGLWRTRAAIPAGANVHARGSDLPSRSSVLNPGDRLGPCEAAAAATFGMANPIVAAMPSVRLLCTGDEIVPPGSHPLGHQIRASHPAALRSALRLAGFACPEALLVPDLRDRLDRAIHDARGVDALLCTGGVSVGERDLVPGALVDAGFRPVFHGVSMKPGKPLWFGVDASGRTAFGLPGNPVSALVSLVRFVVPHLRARSGAGRPDPWIRLPLVAIPAPDARTRFLPVRIEDRPDGAALRVASLGGSGDLAGLVGTDGFVEIPPGSVASTAVFRPWC